MSVMTEAMHSPAGQYATDVLEGRVRAPATIRQQAQHFVDDLRRAERGGWRYRYDPDLARRPVRFCEMYLRPTAGRYDKFAFMPWQEFVDCQAFGWIDTRKDARRYREVLEMVGRGNGKTARMSGKMGYMSTKGGEPGAENYFCANNGQQARRCYLDFYGQMSLSPVLKRQLKLGRNETCYEPDYTRVGYLTNDTRTLDGLRPYFVSKDELEAEVSFDQINQLLRPMKKRTQPLMWYTMTGGTVLDGPGIYHYLYAKRILERDPELDEMEIDRYLPIIYEIDQGLDVEDPDNWILANPSVGVLLDIEDMILDYNRAKRSPSELADFMTKQLNVFAQAPESVYVSLDTMRANDLGDDPPPMGCRAWAGFDLSKSEDVTSAAVVLDLPDGRTGIIQHSWMPQDKLDRGNGRETKDWQHWIERGWLSVVPGHYVRYEPMLDWLKEQRTLYELKGVGYDPYNATQFVKALTANGFLCRQVRQGPETFNAPMKAYKEELLDGNVRWWHDEMYAWYLRNVRLRADFFSAEKENWYPTRRAGAHKNATRKIDGFMAAMDGYILREQDRVVPGDCWRGSRPIAFGL